MVLMSVFVVSSCSDDESGAPELVDDSGVVDDWYFSFDVRYGLTDGDVEVVQAPGGWNLRVVWSALPCQTAPIVRVEGQDGQLSAVLVDPGPAQSPSGGGCDSSEAFHTVDLKTSGPPNPDMSLVE
ncbi:MAG: hypothetical protein ACRDWI_00780 [Jiangellaceae bacterium]